MVAQTEIARLASSWVATDTAAIRADVSRLGSVSAAAEYSAEMAIRQPDWESLSCPEGIAALVQAIAQCGGGK